MHIDVYQDTVCPWCRIGKRSLELALEGWEGEPVTVRYHSFFLNPEIPAEGYDFKTHMLAKGRGRMTLADFFGPPTERGAAIGLTFNFDAIERAPNTTLSHQLAAIAPEAMRSQLTDALYTAYFEDGKDIGDIAVLAEIAAKLGMDPVETRQRLLAGEGLAQVEADVITARRLGISGVPFFVINNQVGFSGAQPVPTMRRVLDQVAAESVAADPVRLPTNI